MAKDPAKVLHRESIFSIPKMDCPFEENLIRMTLSDLADIQSLTFDLWNRRLAAIHQGDPEPVLALLRSLDLGAVLLASTPIAPEQTIHLMTNLQDAAEARILRLLLTINAIMFFLEFGLGIVARSTGLIADSIDMFADAVVYALALYVVGRAASLKARAAHFAGWLQVLLAIGALGEVMHRFLYGGEPVSAFMIVVGMLALAANIICLMLISCKRDHGVHMKATYIFSANDVIANIGVIVAGFLVNWTHSPYPDLVIGTIVSIIVMNGGRRILQLR